MLHVVRPSDIRFLRPSILSKWSGLPGRWYSLAAFREVHPRLLRAALPRTDGHIALRALLARARVLLCRIAA